MALGVAILGSIGTAVYRQQVDVPANVSTEVAVATRDSLVSTTAAAEKLPTELADVLLNAREAFMAGLNVVSVVGAVILLGLSILAIILFRHEPLSSATDDVTHFD
ncbi:hypothetical protein [Salibacterium halotolerans]|uniref:MFS transporter, DHA2 family, multidrug resistance protein n=1 Tax=Salibacterium halotolerans TaxID=1884432 RepID=A0A1I5YAU4_9BACI|nr:hypothetical protein [Salibacterium halotolerans]SFQ41341.1 MFS transporter, DHA2 family, multidrug resistance protein [Salibacterium halotolerans]